MTYRYLYTILTPILILYLGGDWKLVVGMSGRQVGMGAGMGMIGGRIDTGWV